MSEPLDVTRNQLRKYLIPGTQDATYELDAVGDHFPRSKVMRFAFNPRNRHLLLFSGSILAVLVTRLVGTERIGVATDIARSFMRSRER